MNEEERLILMKKRILDSFKWHSDVIVPMADYFEISVEEMEDIFMNAMDMGSLESLHSTFDSAKYICLKKKFCIDLNLCWFAGASELLTTEQAEDIQTRLADEVYANEKTYEDALKEGKQEILEILRGLNIKEV